MRPMYETAAALMATEFQDDFKGLDKAEDMLRVAFKKAYNHWMFSEEQDQFKGAVGAVLITLKSGPEFDRVNEALRQLSRASALISALQQGIPVDWDSMEKPDENAPPVIPLNQLWCEVKWPKKQATG